jgi:hypothetical protein
MSAKNARPRLTCPENLATFALHRVLVEGSTMNRNERSRLVPTDIASNQSTSTAVALFQKAHGRMTTMQRIDEQIVALMEQRRKLQDELRTVQALINEEFDRVTRNRPETPSRMLVQMPDQDHSGNGQADSELTEAAA